MDIDDNHWGENETGREWINRISKPSKSYDNLEKKQEHRKRFKLYYKLKTWFALMYLNVMDMVDQALYVRVLKSYKDYYLDVIDGREPMKPIIHLSVWAVNEGVVTKKERTTFNKYLYEQKPSETINAEFYHENEPLSESWFKPSDDPLIIIKFINHLLTELK